jgi:hypothetical protein
VRYRLRTRKLRAALSALGIAIGVAAIVAVLGLAQSSQAGLLAEIAKLGTNLLTVTNGTSITGGTAELPKPATGIVSALPGVTAVRYTGTVSSINAYRSPYIPTIDTNALSVDASSLGLPASVGTSVAQGTYLNAATANEPVAVLGYAAGHRPDLAAGEDLGRRHVVLRGRDPEPGHPGPADRLLGPDRLPRGGKVPALRRASVAAVRADSEQPGRHHQGRQPPGRAGRGWAGMVAVSGSERRLRD